MDIGPAFAALSAAAYNVTSQTPEFSPYFDVFNFILGAYIFEDVGVTAYKGAAPLILNRGILAAASSILGTESYHAGIIRAQVAQVNVQTLLLSEILIQYEIAERLCSDGGFYLNFKPDSRKIKDVAFMLNTMKRWSALISMFPSVNRYQPIVGTTVLSPTHLIGPQGQWQHLSWPDEFICR